MSKPILTLPCKQNLQTFEKRELDYYCNSCDKVLTDFREKSDSEIEFIIANATKQICGIMHYHQADHKRSTIVISQYQSRVGLSLLGILGFLGPVLTSCEEASTRSHEIKAKKDAFNTLHFPLILKGTLTDNNSFDPLIDSEVELIQDGKVVRKEKINEKGEFEIRILEKDLKNEAFELAYHSPKNFSDTIEEKVSTVGTSPLLIELYAIPAPVMHIEKINYSLKESMIPLAMYGFYSPAITPSEAIPPLPYDIHRPLQFERTFELKENVIQFPIKK
nr:hypothetical protein [uncultured Fluviicola sp.]